MIILAPNKQSGTVTGTTLKAVKCCSHFVWKELYTCPARKRAEMHKAEGIPVCKSKEVVHQTYY